MKKFILQTLSKASLVLLLMGISYTVQAQAPPNDECTGAETITCGQSVQGSTVGANPEILPFCGTSDGTGGAVWYQFTGTGDGIKITTCNPGTDYDTKLRVYTGSCGTLTCVAGDDDDFSCPFSIRSSSVSFFSIAGEQYLVLVHGFVQDEGNFEMTLTCFSPPPNNVCQEAIPITCGQNVQGSTVLASPEISPFCGTSDGTGGAVWYQLSGVCGNVTLSTCNPGTDYDTKLRVYTGTCDDLTCVTGDDDSSCPFSSLRSTVHFSSVPGTIYYVLVHGFSSNEGNYELSVSIDADCTVAPGSFDNCPENCLVLNCEDEGWEYIIQAWLGSVTASGFFGLPATVTHDYDPDNQGRCIGDGTAPVTWTAQDACRVFATCTSMIVIADTEPPHFIQEAQDELDICNYGTPAEFDAWVAAHGNAQGYDGCWGDELTWTTIPNDPSIACMDMMGSTSVTVTFVARDGCGNKAATTATFTALMTGGDLVEGGDGVEEEQSRGFALYQNLPNPFRNETLISFNLLEASAVTLTIYNVSGKVLRMIQGDYSQGYNEIQLNRSELSSTGVLYYELKTETDFAAMKMILID